MNSTKKVYIVRNLDNGMTLYNKVTGLWNDNSKPHLNGRKVWTFAIKKAGMQSPAIQDAIVHLGKLGFKNIQFEEAEVDKVTNELVNFAQSVEQPILAIPEITGEANLPAPVMAEVEVPQDVVADEPIAETAPVAEAPQKSSKKAGKKKSSKKAEKVAA